MPKLVFKISKMVFKFFEMDPISSKKSIFYFKNHSPTYCLEYDKFFDIKINDNF